MDKIDLEELERLAKAATPGTWYCTRTIQEELGLEPHDWGHIMLKPREGESWPIVLAKMNMWFATEEEQRAERTRYFCGQGKKETRDPGQPGRDAEFIVAACNAVPELIARIRELEEWRNRAIDEAGYLLGCMPALDCRVCDYLDYCPEPMPGFEPDIETCRATMRNFCNPNGEPINKEAGE